MSTPSTKQQTANVLDAIFTQGVKPQTALGLSQKAVDALYNSAYHLYMQGNYDKAIKTFQFLCLLDPAQYRFMFALGAAHQMKKNFMAAATYFTTAAFLDPSNPAPYYHAAECYLNLNDVESALLSLDSVIQIAKKNKKYETFQERARLIKKSIQELEKSKTPNKK